MNGRDGVNKLQEIFKRIEKKYILNKNKKEILLDKIKEHIISDKYGPSTICNIYYDNLNHDLIRTSIDKPIYKEKVRLRSYNVPDKDSKVFLEIKKKYDGIVYKRRVSSTLKDIESFLECGEKFKCNKQILNELEYCFKIYHLVPMLFLAYDREAYYDKDDKNFRITFDTNIIARDYDLKLEKGVYGEKLYDDNTYVMEVKCLGGLPLWFVKIINELEIYPTSFSKYGKVYINSMKNKKEKLHQ